jgi:tight adherence protein C
MAIALALFSFLLLASAITWYGYRFYLRAGRVYEQVDRAGGVMVDSPLGIPKQQEGFLVRVIRQVGEQIPVSPAEAGLTRRYLMAAGFRSERAIGVLNGSKVGLLILMVVFALAVKDQITVNGTLGWIIVAAAALLGWLAPGMILDRMIERRQLDLRLSLPDALDMMVICVEAGHALDQAFLRVGRELMLTHPAICEEFGIVTLEMRAGKRRAEALRNLAARTGERELQKLVAIMIQADRFGTSIADSLRVHADFMRIRRRQEAEERAGKIGVKLIFPIFFFILPSMFLVTAGPGVLQVAKYLLPTLKQAVK